MTKNIPQHILGIDLGDKKHHLCVLDRSGEEIECRSLVNNRAALKRLSKKYPEARIVMEVGTHSPWTCRQFEQLGHEVLVANARKLRFIFKNERKSDEADARLLARVGRFDPKLLYPIRHGSEESQKHWIVLKQRDSLVRRRVELITSVRSAVKSLGMRMSSSSAASFSGVCREELERKAPDLLVGIEGTLEVLELLTEKIRAYDLSLEEISHKHHSETARLREIAGVGPVTALAFVLVIGDPERFSSSRAVGAYLGLCPKRDQSGETDKELRISKTGNAYLRRLLVGCSQYIMGPHGPDCDLRAYGEKLANKGGKLARRKAVVAVARKLAVLLHRLWVSGEHYQPQMQQAA